MSPPCASFCAMRPRLPRNVESACMSLDIDQERSSARVAELAIWSGRVDPLPLAGGITNQNFTVEDRGRRYVVRVGERHPRSRRGARERAGGEPRGPSGGSEPGRGARGARHSRASISSRDAPSRPRTYVTRANLERLVDMVRRCHRDIPQYLRGPAAMFWVFHVVRDYGHTLSEGRSRHVPSSPDLLARAARLEATVGPIEVVFGHNDLLAANFIDDGTAGCGWWTGSMPGSIRRCSISVASPPIASFLPSRRSRP